MPLENAKKIFEKMHEVVEHPEKTERIRREVAKLAKEKAEEPLTNRLLEWERKKEAKE